MLQLSLANPRDVRNGWLLWTALVVVVAVFVLFGKKRFVTVAYDQGADRWLAGADLYEENTGHGFIYLPQAAILYVPFSLMPPAAAEIAWRACTIGLFVGGAVALTRRARQAFGDEPFSIMTTVAAPLAFSSARNGQSTLAIAGLTMLAACALAEGRWRRAAVLLSLGVAVKPLMIVPVLLAGAMYRPMLWRLAVGLTVASGAPFLFASSQYVLAQYYGCAKMLSEASKLGTETCWAQLFGIFKAAGIDVSSDVQTTSRVIAAGLTLAACLWARKNLSPAWTAIYLYTLAGCYLMLFNPRTENNGYSFIGPAIGLFCAHAWLVKKDKLSGAFLIVVALGVVGSYEIGRLFTDRQHAVWLAPLMCTLFAGYVVAQLMRRESSLASERTRVDSTRSAARPTESWRSA